MSKSKNNNTPKKVITSKQLENHINTNKRQVLKDLKNMEWNIEFKNPAQKRFYNTIDSKDITFCIGPAGCGKTYLSVYHALKMLGMKDNSIDGIVIVKPLVEADGEKIGYLPGDIDEKTAPFMMSFYYNMEQIIGKNRLEVLKNDGVILVIPLAFMRGITLTDKIVILDEAQNATPEQIKMFVTRIGERSKYIITGDLEQSDLKKKVSGLEDAIKRFAGIRGVGLASFKEKDIVRHPLVKKLLKRYHDNFTIIDEISAEKTISMWVNENSDISIPYDDVNIKYKLK